MCKRSSQYGVHLKLVRYSVSAILQLKKKRKEIDAEEERTRLELLEGGGCQKVRMIVKVCSPAGKGHLAVALKVSSCHPTGL